MMLKIFLKNVLTLENILVGVIGFTMILFVMSSLAWCVLTHYAPEIPSDYPVPGSEISDSGLRY